VNFVVRISENLCNLWLKIAEKHLTDWSVGATITLYYYYGSMVGPVTLYGQVNPVVGLAGPAKEARKTIVSGK